jgi:hypothetical protein
MGFRWRRFLLRICLIFFVGSFSLLFDLGNLLVCAGQQDSSLPPEPLVKRYVDGDAYAIYAILLASVKDSLIVIQTETDSRLGATPENMGIKGDRSFYKVWGPVLKDYAEQYRDPKLLTRNFHIEVPYELVPKQEIWPFLKSERNSDAFQPSSRGYYWFSAVGFDHQKTHAIVQMNYLCGGFCGGGRPHFFLKKNGKWSEVTVNAEVMVWAS